MINIESEQQQQQQQKQVFGYNERNIMILSTSSISRRKPITIVSSSFPRTKLIRRKRMYDIHRHVVINNCICFFAFIVSTILLITTTTKFVTNAEVIRKNNLDYFDATTMNYYLNYYDDTTTPTTTTTTSPYEYDVVVLMYAKWCKNCHALAPVYNQIAQLLEAGTNPKSNLIMGLFDCETSLEHAAVCNHAGVTHYPTILYFRFTTTKPPSTTSTTTTSTKKKKNPNLLQKLFGGGSNDNSADNEDDDDNDIFGKKSGTKTTPTKKKKKKKPVPKHVTKFGGNWQYSESILDWIKTMRFISRYQRLSFRKILYQKLFFFIPGVNVNNGEENDETKTEETTLSSLLGSSSTKAATPVNKKKQKPGLPIGIPTLASTGPVGSSSTSSTNPYSSSSTGNNNNKNITERIDTLEKQYTKARAVAVRLQTVVDTMLVPISLSDLLDESNKTYPLTRRSNTSTTNLYDNTTITNITASYTDIYTYMYLTDSWNISTKQQEKDNIVFVTCLSELVYDYCNKLSNQFMYQWIDKNPDVLDITDDVYDGYIIERDTYINTIEPYCIISDSCISTNFINITCRPSHCPFRNDIACRYINACLNEDLYYEYNTAIMKQQREHEQKQQKSQQQQYGSTTTTTAGGATGTTAQKKQQQQQYYNDGTGTTNPTSSSKTSSSTASSSGGKFGLPKTTGAGGQVNTQSSSGVGAATSTTTNTAAITKKNATTAGTTTTTTTTIPNKIDAEGVGNDLASDSSTTSAGPTKRSSSWGLR